ncbi:MAG: hypothetical protein QXT69_01325 [Fervidicoccaceae archaeon]
MKATIVLAVNKRYSQAIYSELRRRRFIYLRDMGWLIPVERVKEFEEVTGTAIELDDNDISIVRSLQRSVEEAEVIIEEKGESSRNMEIAYDESVYRVTLPSGMKYTIPSSIVQAYREVVEELRKQGISRIKKKELVEIVLRKIGFSKFFSRDGSYFYWETFYGDRVSYHTHYYIPVKILESMGLIIVTKQDEVIIRK